MSPAALDVWRAPLVPVALAATAGIVLDRLSPVPLPLSLATALLFLLAWVLHLNGSRRQLRPVFLWGCVAALGCAHHHYYRHGWSAQDIRHLAGFEPQPARLRGILHTAPTVSRGTKDDPLRSQQRPDSTRFILRVTHIHDFENRTWVALAGRVQVTVDGRFTEATVGDQVEMPGRLLLPEGPANPGEADAAAQLHDQHLSARFLVQLASEIDLLQRGWPTTLFGWLAVIRGWGQGVLSELLPAPQRHLAAAILLGDGSGLDHEDWERFLRTGVVHVLVISGHHLFVLAGFLVVVLKLGRVPRRRAALVLAGLLLLYALLTGGRPPVMRAAWMVTAYCGGVLFLRPVHPANTLSLAWLGIALFNPTDLFQVGCQLSFLAVAVLVACGQYRFGMRDDPLQRALEESRPWLVNQFFACLRWFGWAYVINAAVWLAVAPLVAMHYHTVSPIALLIGPPVVLLASFALITGFIVLLLAPWCWPLAWVVATLTQWTLAFCDLLVRHAYELPGAFFFVPDVPLWWLGLFYVGVLLGLTTNLVRQHWRVALPVGTAWLALGLVLLFWPHRPGEFRCTFLAVGHGSCIVIETPQGRVLVYDAGSMRGPDVARRQIAPFLWQRGIRRIDELFLSHADLDHFNGIPELLKRFTVSRVTCTPTFAERPTPAVQLTLAALQQRGVPLRVVHDGMSWDDDGVSFTVLHPPRATMGDSENARSLVLELHHRELAILLTGDLEGAGLERVLRLPARRVDVLMAPHHGSRNSNKPPLAAWAKPQFVVSCQDVLRSLSVSPYDPARCIVLGTWPHGAVTIRQGSACSVETFRSRQTWPLRPDSAP